MGLVEILVLLQPFFLGKTIDGIINKNYSPLLVLIGIYVGYIIFLYKRMVYDTKVYTKIYNDIVINFNILCSMISTKMREEFII